MTTLVLIAICGLQPPVGTQSPAIPPAPKVDRKVPPPIPQPPPVTRSIEPSPAPAPSPATPPPLEDAPPPSIATAPAPAPQKTIQHAFLRQHDINVDGRLEPAELERRFGRNFVIADLNRDGFLDGFEILHDRHNIGRTARRMEGLDFDREGRLVFKGDKPPIPIANIARGVIDMLDPDGDGYIHGRDVGDAVKREVLPRLGPNVKIEIAAPPSALPTRPTPQPPAPTPTDPSIGPSTQPATPPAPADPKTGQGTAAPKKKKDELPSAEATILHLDKDGDGQLSESEAVDQLAKNFKTLDKNRDNKLSRDEIDRGLRLARLFGIKPMKPPETYRDDSASKGQTPPK
jgi:hypothetical protein